MTKIMLVEDDLTILSLLSTLLHFEGYQVTKVEDFGNVLDEIRSEKPDLVLMDVHLEEVDGISVLADIRKEKPLKKLKVIMSSGMDHTEECLAKGADDFILKPYMPDELIERIKKVT